MESQWSVFYPENYANPVTDTDETLYMRIKRSCTRYPDRVALEYGATKILYSSLLEKIDEAQAETASNTGLTLIVMLSYSGKWDLVQAASRYAADACEAVKRGEEPKPLDEALFSRPLSSANTGRHRPASISSPSVSILCRVTICRSRETFLKA